MQVSVVLKLLISSKKHHSRDKVGVSLDICQLSLPVCLGPYSMTAHSSDLGKL